MSVSLSPYPEYKDSGLPWLGRIPAHWGTSSIKRLLSRMDYGTSANLGSAGKVRILTMGHIQDGEVILPETGSLETVPPKLYLEGNDLLFNRTNSPELVGKVGIFRGSSGDLVSFASYLVRLRFSSENDPKYMNHLLNCYTFTQYARSQALVSLHQANLNSSRYGRMPIAVPPKSEQRRIADFLDEHGKRINRLIQTKQRLIELLNEQKQAIIHNAVTRGLDPGTPMKPIGLDWLPEVPEHWEVRPLKQISKVHLSGVDKHSIEGEQSVLLCNYTDVYNNDSITPDIDFMSATATDMEIDAFTIAEGDVLITKDSEASDDIAVPALVRGGLDGVICGYHLAMLRPDASSIIGEYLFLALYEVSVSRQFHISATGVTRFGISKQDIKNAVVPLPPLDEQSEIYQWLAQENKTIDAAIRRARSEIDLIGEYRTRLISDVVTGKLDVRGVELPEVEEIEDAPGVEETLLSGFADFAEESHIAP